ncbi:hypothetical protein M3Y97_00562000 [Aphelenchoides bicaudatus]|nr:hypothetical protein M3Y97_00562000 [Aphelenchoides bicaudatus]
MTDFMREMINELMGAQRAEEDGRRLPPYDDRSVCRAYLLDCCPREILADTRLENLVLCRKLHEKALQSDYLRAQEKRPHFYELEGFDALEECVRAVDYEISKTREKVKKDSEHLSDSQDFIKSQKIGELNDKINITLAQMEALGNEGKVNESIELSRTVSELQRKKQDLENDLRSGQPTQQRLRVCEACGAQLNVLDHESRLADHFNGKMHLGMVTIREKYDEMKKTIDERRIAKREYEDKHHRSDRDRRRRSRSRDSRERRDRDRRRSRSRSPRSSRSSRRHSSRERRRH